MGQQHSPDWIVRKFATDCLCRYLAVLGQQLDSMILKVFSDLNDSMSL